MAAPGLLPTLPGLALVTVLGHPRQRLLLPPQTTHHCCPPAPVAAAAARRPQVGAQVSDSLIHTTSRSPPLQSVLNLHSVGPRPTRGEQLLLSSPPILPYTKVEEEL